MLKLTRLLLSWTGDSSYIDYYERALYNHILGQQNPETGMFCYMIPLRTGSVREYSSPFDSFWCCVGSGIESHSKYGDTIYFRGEDGSLFLNLFIPSELTWPGKGLRITQQTRFPYASSVGLSIAAKTPTRLAVRVRTPQWAGGGLSFRVNGMKVSGEQLKSGYTTADRIWHDGDVLEFDLPMRLRLEAAPGDSRKVALLYGPIVLAGDLGPAEDKVKEVRPALVAENVLDRIALRIPAQSNSRLTAWFGRQT